MVLKLFFALVNFALLVLVKSECPGLDQLPDKINDNTYLCARFYYGHGHDLAVRGCNGCSTATYADIPDGDDENAQDKYQYPMGSILVKPGCTLYVFHDHNYGGSYDTYQGPALLSHVVNGHDSEGGCAKGNPSFQCRCKMEPVNCTPEDKFAVVLRCDATEAIAPVECNYYKKIGTTFGEELSETVSVSETIEYEISVSIFELFSEKLGISMTTGYDWTTTSSYTKSINEEFQVLAKAPAGMLLTIEQAVGQCGDTEARTELFRIRHTDSKGQIVKDELVFEI